MRYPHTRALRALCRGAAIAALYVLLTYLARMLGLDSQAIQLRFSEALCVLPLLTPTAVPGLTVGCLLANLLVGAPLPDVLFGALATLLGAVGTYLLRKRSPYLAVLPPILANTLIIPLVLKFAYGLDGTIPFFAATVFAGEVLSVGLLGLLLYYRLKRIHRLLHD
jgi:uncharacterized membrane protein